MAYGATGWRGAFGDDDTVAAAIQAGIQQAQTAPAPSAATHSTTPAPATSAPKPSGGGGIYVPAASSTAPVPYAPSSMSAGASAFVKGAVIAAVGVAGLLVAKKKGWIH